VVVVDAHHQMGGRTVAGVPEVVETQEALLPELVNCLQAEVVALFVIVRTARLLRAGTVVQAS